MTDIDFTKILLNAGVQISMDGKSASFLGFTAKFDPISSSVPHMMPPLLGPGDNFSSYKKLSLFVPSISPNMNATFEPRSFCEECIRGNNL